MSIGHPAPAGQQTRPSRVTGPRGCGPRPGSGPTLRRVTTPSGPPPESDRPDAGQPGQQPPSYPGPQYPESSGQPSPGGQYGQPDQYGQPSQYGQPGQYGQPAQYGQPGQYAPPGQYGGGYGEPPKSNGLGIAALVVGILSIPAAFLAGVPGIVLGLIAIVLGIVGLRRVKARRADNRGMAITGVVTGVLGLLLGIAVLAFTAFIVNTAGDCLTEFEQTGDQAAYEQCVEENLNN